MLLEHYRREASQLLNSLTIFLLLMSALTAFLPYEPVLFVHNNFALIMGYAIWCHEQQLARPTLCLIANIYLLLMLA